MVNNIVLPRILNISSNDYANMSHNNANALRSIGIDCKDFTLNKHVFNYAYQSTLCNRLEFANMVNDFNVIQIFHTDAPLLELVLNAKFKGKIIVYHSGSRYRENPEHWNELFNKYVYRCITDQTEFMELGAKDIAYLAPHTDSKPTEKRKEGKLIIGHYPSNPIVKGTKEIREMLRLFEYEYEIRIDETILPHEENLKRIAECHIYIELFKPELNGKPYGCFGVTAFEATALGCTVITNDLNENIYKGVYGESPFIIANTIESLRSSLMMYIEHTPFELEECFNYISADFYDNHSITSTGQRILKLINE